MAPTKDSDQRFKTAEQLVKLFWPERFAYLGLSVLTAALVVYIGAQVLRDPSAGKTSLIPLFGSGGVVAFNIGRLLSMFNKVIKVVFG